MWDKGIQDEPLFTPGPKGVQGFDGWQTNVVNRVKRDSTWLSYSRGHSG